MAAEKTRDKTECKQLLNDLGWKGEEKRYLKVAAAFEKFAPQELAQIEPATIFRLANNSKKYQPVFEQMLELPEITPSAVRELIEQQRKPRVPKPDEPTIWRQTPDGRRYCQIPPIHEENQQTGIILQKMMDEEGLTAQTIVAEAISLRQAFIEGRLVAVDEAAAKYEEMPTELSLEVQCEDLLTETEDVAMPQAACPKGIAYPQLAAEQYSVEGLESFEQSCSRSGDSWNFEVEPELDDDTVEYGNYSLAFSPEENVSTSLSPVELLIHTFQTAANWSEISEVLKLHGKYEQQAWDALTRFEQRRVMAITPSEIKKLNKAKKSGKIVNFYEVLSGVYQVQLQGSVFWEPVSSSTLDAFLMEL